VAETPKRLGELAASECAANQQGDVCNRDGVYHDPEVEHNRNKRGSARDEGWDNVMKVGI
jgi:hypothetical protein